MSGNFYNYYIYLIHLSIVYFFTVNSVYLFLLAASAVYLRRQAKLKPLLSVAGQSMNPFSPSISILAPAYNEQETVVESVKSFLLLEYPSYEVIVVNDGSKDLTLKRLTDAFILEPTSMPYDENLSQTEIRGVYRSKLHPNLTVVDKVNGGKADALNVGIGFAKYEIFCAVDSDSILESDALVKVSIPFLESPGLTIASGGTVRIANGARVKSGRVESVELPKNYLVLMQIIEYTRAFLCGRIGWNILNSTLVISGAFGLFSKESVIRVGGYTAGSIGEDMELVMRLHRHHRENKIPYAIVFVPDPVCWTEAPVDLSSLKKQRDRWQRGLADSLMRNRGMIFNFRFGLLGIITLPYFIFVELLGPVFEVASLLFIASALATGTLQVGLLYTFFLASVLYGALMSISAFLIEEIYFSKYGNLRQFLTLVTMALIESFGYRQLTSLWRLTGIWHYLRGDNSWGHLKRAGFKSSP